MNDAQRAAIQATFAASNNGSMHFGEVIGQLVGVGVEAYHVDYRAGRSTYYAPDGTTADMAFEPAHAPIPDALDVESLRAAILGAQQGRVMYPEFKQLSQQAGCVGYTVWISGRHVMYIGRRGDTHIERFPQ